MLLSLNLFLGGRLAWPIEFCCSFLDDNARSSIYDPDLNEQLSILLQMPCKVFLSTLHWNDI